MYRHYTGVTLVHILVVVGKDHFLKRKTKDVLEYTLKLSYIAKRYTAQNY